jgi:hypothetical protein
MKAKRYKIKNAAWARTALVQWRNRPEINYAQIRLNLSDFEIKIACAKGHLEPIEDEPVEDRPMTKTLVAPPFVPPALAKKKTKRGRPRKNGSKQSKK